MNKKLLLLVVILAFSFKVRALSYGGCEYSQIAKLKSYVTNVNISYSYKLEGNTPIFNVTLNNITPDMYFIDNKTGKTFFYSDTTDGEITISGYIGDGGKYNFFSSKSECYGVKLGTKYYKFPSYNVYYGSNICDGISEFSLCQKWVSVNYDYYTFNTLVNEYKDSLNKIDDNEPQIHKKTILDSIIEFYTKNYVYFLASVIVICGTIILINRRKDRFKL